MNNQVNILQGKLKYIPLSVTLLLSLVSIYLTLNIEVEQLHTDKSNFFEFIEISDNSFNISEIITLVALTAIIILLIIRNNYWAHLFAIVSLLSSFNILQVFLYTYSFKLFFIRVELISFFIFVFHWLLNPNLFEDVKRKLKLSNDGNEVQYINPALIDGFTDRFKSKTNDELEEILVSKQHTQYAKSAARLLLEKRKESE